MGYRLVAAVLDASPHLKELRPRLLLVLTAAAQYARDTPYEGPGYTLPAGFYGFGNDWLITHTGRTVSRSARNHMSAELRELAALGLVSRCSDPRPNVHTTGLMVHTDNM